MVVYELIYLAQQLRLSNKEKKVLKESINYSTDIEDCPVSPRLVEMPKLPGDL